MEEIQNTLRQLADNIGLLFQAKASSKYTASLDDQLQELNIKERQLHDGLRQLQLRSRTAALGGYFNKAEKLAALHDENLLALTRLQKQTIALEVRYYRMTAEKT